MVEKNKIMIKFINNQITSMPLTIHNKTTQNNTAFKQRLELSKLQKFVNEFLDNNINNRFFVISGLRGVGKTTLLYQIYEYLLKEKKIPQNQILYISCEILNHRFKFNILDVIEEFLQYHHNSTLETLNKEIFLFIDEAQYDENWAIAGKYINDVTDKIFTIFTGSSALDLEYNADAARRLVKRKIPPLTYKHYLNLKYGFDNNKLSDGLHDLLFKGKVDNALKYEQEIIPELYNLKNYTDNDLNNYIEYGGFPFSFTENEPYIIYEKLVEMMNRVISQDIPKIGSISTDNMINAYRTLNYLALEKSDKISQNSIANYLECSSSTIKNILDILEKTQIIFHTEAYGSASKRYKKSNRYYFATSSLRNSLNQDLDNPIQDIKAYNDLLLENFVASTLYHLKNNANFQIYYDPNHKNKNVDFIIQKKACKPIPIEVGIGKKNKKQIKTAINKYKSDYGIIISNKTIHIKKEDNIIFLPPKTFSMI